MKLGINFPLPKHRSILIFIGWFLLLILGYLLSFKLPLQLNYLGGGTKHYLLNPLFWLWANFDGEHYVSIAREGYKPLQYFFFPLYPLVMRSVGQFLSQTVESYVIIGVSISIISLFGAFFGLRKLLLLDYPLKFVRETLLLLIIFPTSFYFSAVYTESLFLFFVVWSFYCARKKNWLLAAFLGGAASATRVIGIIMFPVLLTELFYQVRLKKESKETIVPFLLICLVPVGLFLYMNFLNVQTGDPLIFKSSVGIFGEQRSERLIVLPQVFYRYVFKILPHLNNYFPVVFTTFFEFFTGLLFFVLSVIALVKLRISYAVYLTLGYLIPTLAGSFSSMPRYVLVLFPAFIVIQLTLQKLPQVVRTIIFSFSALLLVVSFALFIRGYWIS